MERVRERQAYAGVSRVTFVPVKPSLTSAASGSRLEGCSPDISPCLSSLALSASWTQDPVSLDLPSQGLSVTLIGSRRVGSINPRVLRDASGRPHGDAFARRGFKGRVREDGGTAPPPHASRIKERRRPAASIPGA